MADPDIVAEAERLRDDPGFAASERQRRLLIYLARHSAASQMKLGQTDIARDVLQKSADFDPTIDAHVRIEVSRLRSALALYYTSDGASRSRRLIVPKGQYTLKLERFAPAPQPTADAPAPAPGDCVLVGLSIAAKCGPDPVGTDFAIQGALFSDLCQSPLVEDGALQFVPLRANDLCQSHESAKSLHAHLAVHLQVAASSGNHHCTLNVIDVDRGAVIGAWRGDAGQSTSAGSSWRSGAMIEFLADPLLGLLPAKAARLWPRSRLAVLCAAYKFMATQDFRYARRALPALVDLNRSSATGTSVALEADMLRVGQCFDPDIATPSFFPALDRAREACALDPASAAANLAMGYANLACDNPQDAGYDVSSTTSMSLFGSTKQDSNLLVALARGEHIVETSSTRPSFIADASELVRCLDTGDADRAHRVATRSAHRMVFWIPLLEAANYLADGAASDTGPPLKRLARSAPYSVSQMKRAAGAMFPLEHRRAPIFETLSRLHC